ncbi:MAG: N-acetylmuramoyl-L-alanine amidase [Bacilli bacterium]|nr:N-acetylmuramoyl-L-alanine amidase [Bacilli bacterium]
MKILNKIFGVGIVVIVLVTIIITREHVDDYFESSFNVESNSAILNKYTIYGRIFNMEGSLVGDFNDEKIKSVSLVLHRGEETDIFLNTQYEINESDITFSTSNKINEGIVLDNIEIGNYYILLRIDYRDASSKYYNLENNTGYGNLDYYSITNNGQNKYITIKFINVFKDASFTKFMNIDVIYRPLPKEVYDIVIDPGHGGIDPGAVVGSVKEAPMVLEISTQLKEMLEREGYKVKLTRTGDYNPGGDGIDAYYPDGRVNIPNNVRAKYIFSIHLNSAPYKMRKGGVEIYAPNNADLTLAKTLADNIVKYAKTTYSPNTTDKKMKGVYVRTYTDDDLEYIEKQAKLYNFIPYDVPLSTPYHYIIRETGGINTNAINDGRNPKYGRNLHYNSNIGAEGYLVELGFLVNDNDRHNLINNKRGYAIGLTRGIMEYLNK